MNWRFWKRIDSVKKSGGRKWWLLIPGGALLIIGFWLSGFYVENRDNTLIALLPIATWSLAGYLLYKGFKRSDEVVKIQTKRFEPPPADANAVDIIVKKTKPDAEHYRPYLIKFYREDDEKKLDGTFMEITNFNRYFYANAVWLDAWGDEEKREPFELPDGEYLSPKKYSIVLNMESNERYVKFQRSRSMAKQVSAVVMGIIFSIMTFFFWLTLAG